MVPIIALVVDGWSRGWSRYWTALAGYQLSSFDSAHNNADTRWNELVGSLPFMLWDIGAVIVIALLGLWLLPRSGRAALVWWLVAGLVAVNLGGSYWTHYYVQLLPPLVLAASYAAVAVASRGLRVALAAVLVVPALAWMVAVLPLSTKVHERAIPYFASAIRDRHIAAAVDAETRPDQRIYVLESEALVYFLAQRPTTYPYLWGMPIKKIPSAVPRLRTMLEANDRPTLVILDTPERELGRPERRHRERPGQVLPPRPDRRRRADPAGQRHRMTRAPFRRIAGGARDKGANVIRLAVYRERGEAGATRAKSVS